MATATPPRQPSALHRRPSVELTYDQIAAWLDAKAPELRREKFVAIVAIMHGGLFPAVICSYATDAPLHYLGYDRNTQTAEWQGTAPPPGRLLLCQDIAEGGDALVNCLTMLSKLYTTSSLRRADATTLINQQLSVRRYGKNFLLRAYDSSGRHGSYRPVGRAFTNCPKLVNAFSRANRCFALEASRAIATGHPGIVCVANRWRQSSAPKSQLLLHRHRL